MHSVIFISIRNTKSKRNIEQNKLTNCNNLFPNPIKLSQKIHYLKKNQTKTVMHCFSINFIKSDMTFMNKKIAIKNNNFDKIL